MINLNNDNTYVVIMIEMSKKKHRPLAKRQIKILLLSNQDKRRQSRD